jgi:transposase
MDNFIQVPLNLPDVRLLSTQRTGQRHWLIRVESPLEGAQCRCCGREIRDFHGLDAAVRLRHLPLFDVPIFVEIRPKRYRCSYCSGNQTTTQPCEWYEPRSPNTKAYEHWALPMLINSTVSDAAHKLSVSEETIEGILDRWSARTVDWGAWERQGVIGIDEIALKRGPTATAQIRCARRSSSGSRAHCLQPSTPRSRGRCGRFASALQLSRPRSGSCSSGSSPCRQSTRRPTTCGKT